MQDLAKMNITDRLVLGRRDNNVPKAAPAKPAQPQKKIQAVSDDNILYEVGSDNESEGQKKGVMRLTKATQLNQLTRRVRDATDNVTLARIVRDFVELLDSSRSRTLTKEGFTFLDSLYKQLADPSVYIVPIRTSRKQHLSTQSENLPDVVARKQKTMKMRRNRLTFCSTQQKSVLFREIGC